MLPSCPTASHRSGHPVHAHLSRLHPRAHQSTKPQQTGNVLRPAKSSDKAEDLSLLWSFFLIFSLSDLFGNSSAFSKLYWSLQITNYRHIEVLLFSTSFVISVLFGDVKTEKICSFCSFGRSNIAIFSKRRKIFCLYFITCWKVCILTYLLTLLYFTQVTVLQCFVCITLE